MNVSKCDSPQNQSAGIPACKNKSGRKEYQCSVCPYRTVERSNIRRHMTTHSQERNFTCDHCTKKYKTMQALKAHINCIHQDKKIKCESCNETFPFPKDHKKHMRTERHMQAAKHVYSLTTEYSAGISEKVQPHLPSNSLVTSEPEPIKNKTLAYKKSELPCQKDCRKSARDANTYTGEKPEIFNSRQLEKAGTLNSEKSSASTELKIALAKIEKLQCKIQNLQEHLTHVAAEHRNAQVWIEKICSTQNPVMFLTDPASSLSDNVLASEMPYPGLIRPTNSASFNVTKTSQEYRHQTLQHQKNPEAPKDLSYYSQQVTPEYSDQTEPIDLTTKN